MTSVHPVSLSSSLFLAAADYIYSVNPIFEPQIRTILSSEIQFWRCIRGLFILPSMIDIDLRFGFLVEN